MAKQTINVGTSPNDGTGTPLRTAFQYTNSNFSELYTAVGPSGNNIVVPGSATITGDLTVDTNVLKVDTSNNRVGIGTATPAVALDVVGNVTLSGQTTCARVVVDGSTVPLNGIYLPATNSFGIATNSTERLRVDDSGNVGVGVTPSAWGAGYKALQLGSSQSTALMGSGNQTELTTNAFFDSAWKYQGAGTVAASRYSQQSGVHYWFTAAAGAANATITDFATAKMTLDASGNLGVGVAPTTKLHVAGGALFASTGSMFVYPAGVSGSWTGTGFAIASEGGSAPIGFLQGGSERMRIDASGNLLVGTTSSLRNTAHSFKAAGSTNSFWAGAFQHTGTTTAPRLLSLDIPNSNDSNAYIVYATNSGGNCFNVLGNGSLQNSTGTYGTISDLRLKENISDARNYLADLLKLRVVKYSLKSEASAVATKIGFIAQEVEQVFPALVETNTEDVKSIKTTVLIPMLLKAIQELTARVEALEA
jgi:hypothetical protein